MRNPYLVGERIYLRPLEPVEDAPVTVPWFNDPEVTRFLRRYLPITRSQQEEFFHSVAGRQTDLVLGMVERSSDRLLGVCGLHDIQPRHRNAWIGITIGEKTHWGKGHGTEAMALLVRHAFLTLNLHRVFLHVYAFNDRALHVYQRLGFQVEGRLREDVFHEGRYHDTLLMGLLREEWLANSPRTV